MRPLKNDRGVALLLCLIFLVVLSALAAGYIYQVHSAHYLTNAQSNSARAFYIAEAGLNKAVWYLMNSAPDGTTGGSWRTSGYPAPAGENANDPQREDFADGTYVMWVENAGTDIMITSRAEINNVTRTIRQLFTAVAPVTAAAGSWQEI